MKFSTRKDIEAPLKFVFNRISDFAAIERQIMRRGVELQRTDGGDASGVGLAWAAQAKIRGRSRAISARVTAFDAPNGYTIEGAADGMNYTLTTETISLSRKRTRVLVGLDIRPTTLTARIILQSLKLAKGSMAAKLDTRFAAFTKDIEDRYNARQES